MKTLCICEYCIQELLSRGEHVRILKPSVAEGTCEWCEEEDELMEVEL